MTYTDEEPFHCHLCDHCSLMSNKGSYTEVAHGETGMKNFYRHICCKMFTSSSSRRQQVPRGISSRWYRWYRCDRSQPTLLVSLDLSAAFDTIDHKILINRLSNSFGISGSVLGWLTSCFSNRSQLVRVGQAQSNLTHCTHGVPQGSVLGPILFSIYTCLLYTSDAADE